jgi:microcystin-dependent protein
MENFLGEIRLMSFVFPPKGWALCNGQLLPINQNQALFSLLGTTYGGDGRVNFALPNLQGRIPMHLGNGWSLGNAGGETAHTLTTGELAAHTHAVAASSQSGGGSADPTNRYLGAANDVYHPVAQSLAALRPETVTAAGGGQAHTNQQPYLTLSYCIALVGIFPSRT